MKRIGIIAALCCAFALCLALAGCGGGGASDDAKAAFTGTWNLSGMSQEGKETSSQEIETLAALGLEVNLELNEDGTAALVLFGESMEGTWEAQSPTSATMTVNGQSVPMTIENDLLQMEQNNSSLSFKKADASAPAASDAASAASAEPEASSDSE